MLGLVPGRAHADLEPSFRNVVHRDRLGRQDRWVPVGDAGHQRPEAYPRGNRGQAGQKGPRLEAGAVWIAVERLEVVEDPCAVESSGLRELDSLHQLWPEELMLRGV